MKLNDTTINAGAGAFSGAIVSVVMSPLDVLKTRLQVERLPKNGKAHGLVTIAKNLYKEEGVASFYKGLSTTLYGYVPNWAIYFAAYEYSRSHFHFANSDLNNIASAVTAGAVSTIVTSPIWTIRTRMQTQVGKTDYASTVDAFRKVVRNEGVVALYRGVVPSMFGLIHVAIQFPVYEHLKTMLKERNGDSALRADQLVLASSLSKIIASVTAYPHEVLRARLQDSEHSRAIQAAGVEFRAYNNVRDAVKSIWRDEGVYGFYRGLLPNILRTVPAAVITLVSYEMVSSYLNRFQLE